MFSSLMFSNRQMKVIFNGAEKFLVGVAHGTQEINLLKNSGNLIKDESPRIENLPCSTAIKEIPRHPQLLAGGMTLTSGGQRYAHYVAGLQLPCFILDHQSAQSSRDNSLFVPNIFLNQCYSL
jgi:hypothetical protein